jgi:hypothetical protein
MQSPEGQKGLTREAAASLGVYLPCRSVCKLEANRKVTSGLALKNVHRALRGELLQQSAPEESQF